MGQRSPGGLHDIYKVAIPRQCRGSEEEGEGPFGVKKTFTEAEMTLPKVVPSVER